MKKLGLLVMPLMAVSLLASCGDKPSPSPTEDIKFSADTTVTLDESKTTANINLDWTPTDHSIECSDFTFTLDSGITTATVTPGTTGDRPLVLTVTFASPLNADDKGDLKFHYNDKTAKKEGEDKVEDINVKLPVDPPMTESWILKLDVDSKKYGDLQFKTQTADSVTIDEYIGDTSAVISFVPEAKYVETQFVVTAKDAGDNELTVSYAPGSTASVVIEKDNTFVDNDVITLHFTEPKPPVTQYSISMKTVGTTISPEFMNEGESYSGTITVTNSDKILDGNNSLKSVKLKTSGDDITTHCTDYDPSDDYKSATFTIPADYITDDIEVEVTLKDKPTSVGTVYWNNWDGSNLETDTDVPVGNTPTYDGDTPTRKTDATYVYRFQGWTPDIHDVVEGDEGNIYIADYDKVPVTDIAATIKIVIPAGSEDLTFIFGVDGDSHKLTVDWGDSVVEKGKATHTYAKSGTYTISIYKEDATYIVSNEDGKEYIKEITLKDKITTIPHDAFRECSNLTSIDISDNVTSIGKWAFEDCSKLTDVYFGPASKLSEIGDLAFNGCSSLEHIEIPSEVTSISDCAFYDCSKLAVVSFDSEGNLTTIGQSAFSGCSELLSLALPDNLLTIGDDAFYNCTKLSIVNFASTSKLKEIGDSVFSGCALTSFVFPDTVISVGQYVFNGCNLTNTLTENECVYLPNKSGNKYFALINHTDRSATSITINNDCKIIGGGAFAVHAKLVGALTIPSGVTSIGNYAFYSCSKLEKINFASESSLSIIGGFAFSGCSSITSVENIPNSVTSIKDYAFEACIKFNVMDLTAFTTPDADSVPNLGDGVFAACPSSLQFEVKSETMADTFRNSGKGWPEDINKYTW